MGQVWLQSALWIGLALTASIISPRSWNVSCVRTVSRDEALAIGPGSKAESQNSVEQEIFP